MPEHMDQTDSLTVLRGSTMKLPENVAPATVLEAFPNQFPDRIYMINLIFPEFTSLCPVTAQPDFGSIIFEYIPDKLCVESKSFKLYLFSYRNRGSFMETITNTILEDLQNLLSPCWARVQGLFAPRGATRINVYAEYLSKKLTDPKREEVKLFLKDWRREQHVHGHPLK